MAIFPLLPLFTTAQSCIKEVSYTLETTIRHALPTGVSTDELTTQDYLKARPSERIDQVQTCVNADNQSIMTSTRIDEPSDEEKQKNPVWKSVVDAEGAILYGFDQNIMPVRETSADNELWDSTRVAPLINNQTLENFGLQTPFRTVDQTLLNELTANGLNAAIDGDNNLIIHYVDRDIIYNSEHSYIIHKFYKEDIVTQSITTTFTALEAGLIPNMEIVKTYTPLSNGTLLQKNITKNYLSYIIITDGVITLEHQSSATVRQESKQNTFEVGQYEANDKRKMLAITPNPVNRTHINIQLPVVYPLATEETIISIHNVSGNLIHQQSTTASALQINTETYAKGIYFLTCSQANRRFASRFIVQ